MELKYIDKTNQLIIVDEFSYLKFSDFYKTKNRIIELSYVLINKLCRQNIITKYIRYDNARENKALNKQSNSTVWKLNMNFEYIARARPQ